jgi:hypothetical protein
MSSRNNPKFKANTQQLDPNMAHQAAAAQKANMAAMNDKTHNLL